MRLRKLTYAEEQFAVFIGCCALVGGIVGLTVGLLQGGTT